MRIRLTAYLITALLALVMPMGAHADIEEGEFEIQGWCVTGPDPVFSDAVTGSHNPSAVVNGRPHIHVDDLINDGFIQSRDELYGRAFILSGYWVKDMGADHFRAYVPKSDRGLEEVSCSTAMQVTPNTKDQYLPEGVDVEMLRQKGLGSSGQTNTEQGKRRGEE